MTDTIQVINASELYKAPAAPAKADETSKGKDEPEATTAEADPKAETADESGALETEGQEEREANAGKEDGEDGDDEEELEAGAGQPPKKSRGGFQRKISGLTKNWRQAEQERDEARAEIARLKAGNVEKVDPKKEANAETVAKTGDEPKVDDFESYSEYTKAVTKWQIAESRKADVTETAQKAEVKRREGVVEKFKETAKAASESHDDYAEVIKGAPNNPPQYIAVALFESENGGELEYQLAKRPEEYKRICALPRDLALREIGRFEAKYLPSEEPKPKTKKISDAPAPITPVGGKGTGAAKKSISDPNLSQREYEELRDAQERARNRA